MTENPIAMGGPDREKKARDFWSPQIKHKCYYRCDSCVIKKTAIEAAKKTNEIEGVRERIPHSETCDIVVNYSTPIWWNPLYGKFTFMIASDRGTYELFEVCKLNIRGLLGKKGN